MWYLPKVVGGYATIGSMPKIVYTTLTQTFSATYGIGYEPGTLVCDDCSPSTSFFDRY